jgi:hypothetical protein
MFPGESFQSMRKKRVPPAVIQRLADIVTGTIPPPGCPSSNQPRHNSFYLQLSICSVLSLRFLLLQEKKPISRIFSRSPFFKKQINPVDGECLKE